MNRPLKIFNIVGARPNFMKVAPIHRKMQESEAFDPFLIHTGQHYDEKMSKTFFHDLGMPEPDLYLGVGSGNHAEQTAKVMTALEPVLLDQKPDWVLVVGDVNSTLAATITAVKLHLPVAHVEAGLRSFDRTMPEEINRILTDSVSDTLFVTEQSGIDNLKHEGVDSNKIHFVGNVMIDSLVHHLEKADASQILQKYNLESKHYSLVTLHRPANVDDPQNLNIIFDAFHKIQDECPIVFPIHPRTRKRLGEFGLDKKLNQMKNLHLLDPVGYLEFLALMKQAKVVLTDSGGIQEETTYLGIPCMTLRDSTERPVTVDLGTNTLVDLDGAKIVEQFKICCNGYKKGQVPQLWDGKASCRILKILNNDFIL